MNIPINTVSSEELNDKKRFKPVEFKQPQLLKHLNTSICFPSYTQAYALCVNYVKNWFLAASPKDYFKSVYVEGKHAFGEFKDKSINQLVKKPKPSLTIIPNFDYNFNNENLDWQYGGLTMTTRITHGYDIFFSDKKKNIYIAGTPELLFATFTFKMKVNSRAKQIDLFKFLTVSLASAGVTHGAYVQLDYDIPYEMMLQIAKDANFEIIDDKIKDPIAFLAYLNKHSKVPFLYKLRNINGKHGYFIRPVSYIHLREANEITVDDGERQGQISSNFTLEYNLEVKFPSFCFYRYMSLYQHKNIREVDEDGNIRAIYTNFSYIPETNSKEWPIYLQTDYEEANMKEPLSIEFAELFANSDLDKVIDMHNYELLSPSGFIDVHLYNSDRDVPLTIDWKNKIIKTIGIVTAERSRLVFYVDQKYLNDQIVICKDWKKNRINENPEKY